MGKAIYFLFGFLLILGCNTTPKISGSLQHFSDDWAPQVYLIKAQNLKEVCSSFMGQVLDSANISTDGSFAFKNLPITVEPSLFLLAVQKKEEKYSNKLENEDLDRANYFPIVYTTGETVEITASINAFQNSFTITDPSEENEALLNLRDIRKVSHEEYQAAIEAAGNPHEAIIEKAKALQEYRQPIIEFAKKSNHLLPSLVAMRWVSTNNNYERVPEFLVQLCEKWQDKPAEHTYITQLCELGNRDQLPILMGDKISDSPLPLITGDTTNVHRLLGKQLTLLDFWASWCAPCRKENKTFLVPLWEKYQSSGFQIVGYALESSERAWTNAIKKDGIDRWPNASHLKGDDAAFFKELNLQTIPANLLLDANGKVLAKNLHGEDLVKFVESHLQ